MGRRERPLAVGEDAVVRFAAELRELRIGAGRPTYRKMAGAARYSAATFARAANGRALPSLEVTLAYAAACGGDLDLWRERWEVAARSVQPAPSGPDEGSAPPEPAIRVAERRLSRAWRIRLTIGAAAVATIVGAAALWHQLKPDDMFHNGQDPYVSGCGADQRELERVPIYWSEGREYGRLVLFHSRTCGASWGYVYGPNSPDWAINIITRRIGDGRTEEWRFSGDSKPNSWVNGLVSRHHCVRVEAFVETSTGNGPTATTSCFHVPA